MATTLGPSPLITSYNVGDRVRWFVLALVLVGCGSASRVVVMQHPQTKHTVECRVDLWGPAGQIESCMLAYEQAGYRVVGDSKR